MKISSYAVIIVLVMFFLASLALAGPRGHGVGEASHSKWHHRKKSIKMDPGKMMSEDSSMLRELMDIVKDFKHTPTASQQKRLTEMIERIDEMKMNPCLMMHK